MVLFDCFDMVVLRNEIVVWFQYFPFVQATIQIIFHVTVARAFVYYRIQIVFGRQQRGRAQNRFKFVDFVEPIDFVVFQNRIDQLHRFGQTGRLGITRRRRVAIETGIILIAFLVGREIFFLT